MEILDLERVQNRRQALSFKLDIDDGTDDSLNCTDGLFGLGSIGAGSLSRGLLGLEGCAGSYRKRREGGAGKGSGREKGIVRPADLKSPARQTSNTTRGQHFLADEVEKDCSALGCKWEF
ncbi:hypothetical protein LNV47_24145, partial [Paucibacter sp. DJ4R-1]|nr:hypothetical protein [Paucibacter sp. DJ4R-1]